MAWPRHNVPQYMGNAVWDAYGAVTLGVAVRAMLGDPFAYARSVNVELLARLLRGEERQRLVQLFGPHWPLDERYMGYQWSTETRERLFSAISGRFDRAYLTSSHVWAQLPAAVRAQLEATPPAALPEEAALCAAVLLADLDFAARPAADVWFLESMPDNAEDDAHFAYRDEQVTSLWSCLLYTSPSPRDS